jgi:thiamine-monophosphate kinase
MGERDRIARYFAPLCGAEPGSFSLTDDTAMLSPPQGQQLIVTTDSVIETIHVLKGATPEQFAQKLMRRNLSDIASMGATPWRYTLNLHTPHHLVDDWFAAFAASLAREQLQFGLVLIGGDSTSGATHIHTTMTCIGLIDGLPLRRSSAQLGDDVYVSGSVGGAAYALSMLQQGFSVAPLLAARYHCPEPRLALGQSLRGIATSCIDVSDGLLGDMAQLTNASGLAARIMRDAIPLCTELHTAIAADAAAWAHGLNGGDDYELLFTAPPAMRATLQTLASKLGLPLTRIGEMVAGSGVSLLDANGAALPIAHAGWEHR